jgi:hypothetical protein
MYVRTHACIPTISRATEQSWPPYKSHVLLATIVQLLVKLLRCMYFVSYAETVEFLGKVQHSASKLNAEAATVHLDRFLGARHSGNAQKARKDTILHAFFPKK